MAESLGAKVYRLRRLRQLSQQELADRAACNQALISRLETEKRGMVPSDVLKRLAQTLGCTCDFLVGMYDDNDNAPALRPDKRA